MASWSVYVLVTTSADGDDLIKKQHEYSYCGATLDFKRRLRQHSGELVGGAKYTTNLVAAGYKWRPLFVVTGLQTQRQALQLEMCQKQKLASFRSRSLTTDTKKRIAMVTSGYHKRIKVLAESLLIPQWTSQTDATATADLPLSIYWYNTTDCPTDWAQLIPLHWQAKCRLPWSSFALDDALKEKQPLSDSI